MIAMRLFPLAAALAGCLAACASPGPWAPPAAPPPPGVAVETVLEIERNGAPFARFEDALWRGREHRFEMDGPGPRDGGAGHGLEVSLTPDFDGAEGFWGTLTLAEFDVLADGTRVYYLGMPRVFELARSEMRSWTVTLPSRAGEYAIRVEMDRSFAWRSAQRFAQ